LILIRHGETDYNAERRVQGQLDIELNENGRAQARETAALFAPETVDALYSSDLKRAWQTAIEIAKVTDNHIVKEKRLREMHFGIFQNLPFERVKNDYFCEFDMYRNGDPDYTIPQGESRRQKYDRVVSFIEDILSRHENQRIIIVTHGGVLYDFFMFAFRIPFDLPFRLAHRNCSISRFFVENQVWTLSRWGDTCHLGDGCSHPDEKSSEKISERELKRFA
jgi:probable phosphoglycerate mutase